MIATTEVTRAYARANVAAWEQDDTVRAMRFNAVLDGACSSGQCPPLNGKVFRLGQAGAVPPLHSRCRCWLSPIAESNREPIQRSVPKPEPPGEIVRNS